MINVSEKLAETVQAMTMLQDAKIEVPTEALEIREVLERCVAAEAERDRLRQAIWPGLPAFVSTPEIPQQNFYEAVAEGLRAEIVELKDLLTSARCICQRQGADTAWERFDARLAAAGIGNVTAKVFKVLPSDAELPL